MSWYLANENKIVDQFATGARLMALRGAAKPYASLMQFLDDGMTKNIDVCVRQLQTLAERESDEDVKETATGLAKLMRGQKVAVITQGFGYEDDEEDDETGESLDPPEPANKPRPAARKAKKKAALKKKPPARKAKKKAAPKRDRARFKRKMAELKTELEKLPGDRQAELFRKLEERSE